MGLTGNFDSPLQLDGEALTVAGSSDGADEGDELVSRHVAVHQGGNVARGPATGGLKWTTDPPLTADGFEPAQALAVGCETYFARNVDSLPTFKTFTWSQIVEVEGKAS
jgi:hypothetical protein